MKKELIIERLEATIKMLRQLKTEEFCYESLVDKEDGDCGTVCCVAGWYPKYFPEHGFEWTRRKHARLMATGVDSHFPTALMKYHGMRIELIEFLFYACTSNSMAQRQLCNIFAFEPKQDWDLKKVTYLFAHCLELIQDGKLNDYLLLENET